MMSSLCEMMRIYQVISHSLICHCPFRDFCQDADIIPVTWLNFNRAKSGTGRPLQIFQMQVQGQNTLQNELSVPLTASFVQNLTTRNISRFTQAELILGRHRRTLLDACVLLAVK
ncbi:hypothetical protein ONS95_008060 [Cadophora gregata]|uniref:uncharacterized protein n=1 Tax=Cadophora gregata TaxID=51156 RepID=UPI0026DB2CC6|nr:uncharacterized protein ONS95_008060 [Cadophora gregata]KAK0119201.1 hypothetical protein ONS96_012265 [Cadophora gregata f. sp. sojae]KAK0126462.1 hypothetical protein ONS95_008060 [Cadophora gregata]